MRQDFLIRVQGDLLLGVFGPKPVLGYTSVLFSFWSAQDTGISLPGWAVAGGAFVCVAGTGIMLFRVQGFQGLGFSDPFHLRDSWLDEPDPKP